MIPLTRALAVALVLAGLPPGEARGQSLIAEVDVTAGLSTEDTRAGAVQARIFGEALAGVRFYVDGTWTLMSGQSSDAFGSAYPYGADTPRPMEAFVERTFRPRGWLAGGRLGRYRTPFGIHLVSDHAYGGFLRAPLVRYEDYFALSNSSLEGGLDIIVGHPQLNVEVSVGVPQDPIVARRRHGVDWVVRTQAYRGSLVAGVSYLRSRPARTRSFARGRAVFTGIDVRWMRDGVSVRGEWVAGRPFDGVATRGWYVDGAVHKRAMGRLTAVGRVERLDYDAGRFSFSPRRVTAGLRTVISSSLVAHVNVIRQSHVPNTDRGGAVDVALTHTVRFGGRR